MVVLYDSGVLSAEHEVFTNLSTGGPAFELTGIPFATLGTGTLRLRVNANVKWIGAPNSNVLSAYISDPGQSGPPGSFTGSSIALATTIGSSSYVNKDFLDGSNAYKDFTGPGVAKSLYIYPPAEFIAGFAETDAKFDNLHVTIEGDPPPVPVQEVGPYEKWLPNQGPDWLMGVNGRALKAGLGAELDYQEARLRWGLRARFPTKGSKDTATGKIGSAPDDALAQIGADRRLQRGAGETSDAYAARLQDAWEAWTFAGSHYGVLRALQIAGYADMKIVQQNGRYAYLSGTAGTLADLSFGTLMTCATRSTLPGWMFDWRDDFYSQFCLLFTTDHANLSTASGQAILSEIVRDWKPAKAFYNGAFVITAGRTLGWPTGRTLGTDAALGGNTVRFISP